MGVNNKNRGTAMFGGVAFVPLSTTTSTGLLNTNTLYFSTNGRPFIAGSTGNIILFSSL